MFIFVALKTKKLFFGKYTHRLLYLPISILFLLSFVDCAKRGTPTGGLKDTIPPVIVRTSPENYTINFDSDEIRITFDEFIKLKDLQKNLIISPPLKNQPIITPLSTSKVIKIKLLDTLRPNTTYSINFGQSIFDNNEDNPYDYYKYVFSTGSYIDSLTLSGTVRDAEFLNPEEKVTIMLYEFNETYTDSIIFKEKPTYITVTKDSTNAFELTNLKAGNYKLFAIKEQSNNYTFQPESDRIAFVADTITLPTNDSYLLSLFLENKSYRIEKPKQVGNNQIIFGYSGNIDSLKIKALSNLPNDYESRTYRDLEKDTLHYWYKPALQKDSLVFLATNNNRIDTLVTRIKDMYKDTLQFTPQIKGAFLLNDTVKISANIPIVNIDPQQILITDKDTLAVPATAVIDTVFNRIKIAFPKTENQVYNIEILPGAFIDFFERQNDTLKFAIKTKEASDYGTLTFNIENLIEQPVIVQMVDNKYIIYREQKFIPEEGTTTKTLSFENLEPSRYYVRLIYDKNNNGVWDSGNLLRGIQPETIKYYPRLLEFRANRGLNETFILD